MPPINRQLLIISALATSALLLAACGQTVAGVLPGEARPANRLLTAEQAKEAAEALVRAKEERHAADMAAVEQRSIRTR